MVFIPHNHYQIVYLYFSVFQLVSTNCFYMCILFYSIFSISYLILQLFFNFNFSYFIIIERIYKWKSNYLSLIETRKSIDIQSDNDYEE
jgi:hypothetical protein